VESNAHLCKAGLAKIAKNRSHNTSTRILLVEDAAPVRRVIERILSKAGYSVIVAKDGRDAIEKHCEHCSIELLISDLVLPGKTQGDDVAKYLRRRLNKLPVIFLSGYTPDSLLADPKTIDGAIYLMKPVTRQKFLNTVASMLRVTKH